MNLQFTPLRVQRDIPMHNIHSTKTTPVELLKDIVIIVYLYDE